LRLETLGFRHVAEYVGGKADWVAHALPREGERASIPYASDLADGDPPTCALDTRLSAVSQLLAQSSYGYCLVVSQDRILLGRVRKSAIADAEPTASPESVMEPGPSTVRASTPAKELAERLAGQGLRTAILTTPRGRLLGVFHRDRLERADDRSTAS
jgi:CBS-domain-containing membrane protein